MVDITAARAKFPQYADLSDRDLAETIRKEHYPDWDSLTFARTLGVQIDPSGMRPGPRPEAPPLTDPAPETSAPNVPGMLGPRPAPRPEAMAPTPDQVPLPPDTALSPELGALAALMSGNAAPIRPPTPRPMAPTPWMPNESRTPTPFQMPVGGFEVPTVNPSVNTPPLTPIAPGLIELMAGNPPATERPTPPPPVAPTPDPAPPPVSGPPAAPPVPEPVNPNLPALTPIDQGLIDLMAGNAPGERMTPPEPEPPKYSAFEKGVWEGIKNLGSNLAAGITDVAASVPEAATVFTRGNVHNRLNSYIEAMPALQKEQAELRAILDTYGAAAEAGDHEAKLRVKFASERLERVESEIAKIPDMIDFDQRQMDRPASEGQGFQIAEFLREKSEGVFGTPDPEDQSFSAKLSRGAGSMVGFIGATLLGGVAGGAGTGAALNSSALYKEAKQMGASEEDALKAARYGGFLGLTEVAPIQLALKLLPKGTREEVASKLAKRLGAIIANAGAEGAQEALVGIGNNLIAAGIYDPERGTWQDVGEQFLIGAILGGKVSGVVQFADAVKERRSATPPPKQEDEPDQDGPPTPPTPDAPPAPGAPPPPLTLGPDQLVPGTPPAPEGPPAPLTPDAPPRSGGLLPPVSGPPAPGSLGTRWDTMSLEQKKRIIEDYHSKAGIENDQGDLYALAQLPWSQWSHLEAELTAAEGGPAPSVAPEPTPPPAVDPTPEQPSPVPPVEARPAPVDTVNDENGSSEASGSPESSAQGGEISLDTEGGKYEFYPELEGGQPTGRHIRVDMETGDMDVVGEARPATTPDPTPQPNAAPAPEQAETPQPTPSPVPENAPAVPAEPEVAAAPEPDAAPAPVEPSNPRRPKRKRAQKRPFTNQIKIDPSGPAARELAHNDITPRTVPGLFKKGGYLEVDNLVADDYYDFRYEIGEDGQGYLDRQGVIDAIVAEHNGTPMRFRDRQELEQLAQDRAARFAAENPARAADPVELDVPVEITPDMIDIIDPEKDISTEIERRDEVSAAVDQVMDFIGIKGEMTPAEVRAITDRLVRYGGNVEGAIDSVIRESVEDVEQFNGDADAESQTEIPGFEADAVEREAAEGNPGRPESPPPKKAEARRLLKVSRAMHDAPRRNKQPTNPQT